jgi:hypothetical protein
MGRRPRDHLCFDRAGPIPAGAPDLLIVLIDDVGFGASSAFGGPVDTPTAERLAGEALKSTRLHTTAAGDAAAERLPTRR